MASNYQSYTNANDFETLNSNISSSIYKIRQNGSQLTQLSKQIGTSKDTESLRNSIHKIFVSTNELIVNTSASLKKLSSIKTNASELTFSKSTRAFESEMETYGKLQKQISDKMRANAPVDQQYENEANLSDGEERSSLLKQKQKRISGLDERQEMVRDREVAIQQIESDILDINSIMRDLASMVNDQSSLVDNISSNVESTNINVENANTELFKANRYASKYRKKVLILILIIVVVLVALGLIIYFSIKK